MKVPNFCKFLQIKKNHYVTNQCCKEIEMYRADVPYAWRRFLRSCERRLQCVERLHANWLTLSTRMKRASLDFHYPAQKQRVNFGMWNCIKVRQESIVKPNNRKEVCGNKQ